MENKMKREEVGKSGMMLKRVVMTSYAIPEGITIGITHERGCRNANRNNEMIYLVEQAKPKVVTEFEFALRGVMLSIGCKKCGVDKEQSAGILFDHSQDTEYKPERTQESIGYVSIDSPTASAVSSWGNSTILDKLPSSERTLYKNYKDDRTSDEDYEPTKTMNKEVSMNLGDGKNTEGTGVGNSKYAIDVSRSETPKRTNKNRGFRFRKEETREETPVPETQVELPSSIQYERSSLDKELFAAIEDIEDGKTQAPLVDEPMEYEEEIVESILSDHDRIIKLEEQMKIAIGEIVRIKNENDDLTERCDDLESRLEKAITKQGADKGKGKEVPYVPKVILTKEKTADVPTMPGPSTYKMSTDSNGNGSNYTRYRDSFVDVAKRAEEKEKQFEIVKTKKEARKNTKLGDIVKTIMVPERERRLSIRFNRRKSGKQGLPTEITTEHVRTELNKTLKGLNLDAYFAKANRTRMGDVHLCLAKTRATEIVKAKNAMTECIRNMGMEEFVWMPDTKKVKIYLADVPLMRDGFGGDWKPEDWHGENAFDTTAADIERSNPGIFICSRPSWVGKLHVMKERKQWKAGMIILCEETDKLKAILGSRNPKMLVGGRNRHCRTWRENAGTIICDKCLSVGHGGAECRSKSKCKWCRKEHHTSIHKCQIVDCAAPKGMCCMHCTKQCTLCEKTDHYTGYRECSVLVNARSTPPKYGKSTPVEADNDAVDGITDNSRLRLNKVGTEIRKTTIGEQASNNKQAGDDMTIPSNRGRSASTPPLGTTEDVFFIVDCPVTKEGEYVEHENAEYEMVSSVKNGDIEVYIRRGIVGWFEIEYHEKKGIILTYQDNGKRRIGAVYIRPNNGVGEVYECMERMKGCNLIMGDMNARNPKWGKDSGDNTTNANGRKLAKWIDENNYDTVKTTMKTFRTTSTIDLTLFKKANNAPKRTLTDKCGLEHVGQIIRINATKPKNLERENVAWKKVDWKELEEQLKNMEMKEKDPWKEVTKLVEGLPRVKMGTRRTRWWTKELETMSKDIKVARRRRDDGWKLMRKVFRNMMLMKRYEWMKEDLGNMKDPDIFKAIKQLEGKRAIPPITNENGETIFEHEKISDMIAAQLDPSEHGKCHEMNDIRLDITDKEIEYGLKTSPSNTANGIDKISYPFLRFWYRKNRTIFHEMTRKIMKEGCEEWKKAETILIKKGDKERYDKVKSWRMIHLLPTMSKVVDRIILGKLAKTVRLEDTQYGSRKNRSTHDAMKQILEFLEYNKDKYTGVLSMDVEGGFDKVNIDTLCDILMYRECEPEAIRWIRRWTIGRRIELRFNGKVSKEYHLNKGVPQGSPLSPFLFGVYVADIFKPRFETRIGLRRMVTSYVDDGVILVSTDTIKKTKTEITTCLEDCKRIAKKRGMDFSDKKMDWMGIGKGNWGYLDINGSKLQMSKEIRILGYRLNNKRGWKEHMEYWTERGIGIKRNIAGIGRRYGSKGGIGAWECMRLLNSVYMPTVCYGLEFLTAEKALTEAIQIMINDTIRSTFRVPIKYANKILYAETGILPMEVRLRELERKADARYVEYEYGKNLPWYGCIAEKWKDNRITKRIVEQTTPRKIKPVFEIDKDKERNITTHAIEWERRNREELWVYTDGSKSGDEAAMSWIMMEGDELLEEVNGIRVPGEWDITKIEICAIGMALRNMGKLRKKKIRIMSDSMAGIEMIKEADEEGETQGIWEMITRGLNEWEEVKIVWVPGHKGIRGNEEADKVAKAYRNRKLNENGKWKDVDYPTNNKTKIRAMRENERRKWHNENGHNYYERLPKKPTHMKDLTRLDYYVLMRIRSGTDKRGHEDCVNYDSRHHLALCPKYNKSRPELSSLYDDRSIDKWKEWWTINEYLNMGIPTNTESHNDTRIMYGNPFDSTITIERNGKVITENTCKKCPKCEIIHDGRCMKKATIGKGRWFFLKEGDMECKICGGKYGGGSTSRPGGSGLLSHIRVKKDTCGKEWEKLYWTERMERWNEWDEEHQMGLIVKWVEMKRREDLKCGNCGKEYNVIRGLKEHLRREDECCMAMVKIVMDFVWD